MCGFVAEYNTRSALKLERIRHRGPDAELVWAKEKMQLGHVRLSIVDLSPAGNQPFHSEDQRVHLVCNGEIYNALELRKILLEKGHQFISNSDNEVVLHGYEEWGTGVIEKLIGMFAFVIWDEKNACIVAARDHVGIKPLYFCSDSQTFSAASELQGIRKAHAEIEPLALAYYLGLGYIPSPLSLYKSYAKLQPGHFLVWKEGVGARISCYWQPPDRLAGQSAAFEPLFENVLKDHLMADVPIGLFLSAGLDSTSVALGLSRAGYRAGALTIGFSGSVTNESKTAAETASFLRIPHQIIDISQTNARSLVEKSATIYDEPQGFSALLTMMEVCKAAAGNYKVLLSGDGGDEVLGGYSWYNNIQLNFSSRKRRNFSRLMYGLTGHRRWLRTDYFQNSSDLHRHVWRLFPRFLPEEINRILSDYSVRFSDELLLEPLKRHFVPSLPLKRALQRVDLMTFCVDSINPKVDRASMAFALEIRVPFLDKRLIEFGISHPVTDSFDAKPKNLLRSYLSGNVPQSVLNQPKQGFSMQAFSPEFLNSIRQENKTQQRFHLKDADTFTDAQNWTVFNLNQFLSAK